MSSDRIDVELHCHSYASPDCLLAPADILEICRERGIDRIAFTDHNAISGALQAAKRDPERVIIGEEIQTTAGEILAFFVQEPLPAGLEPFEAIDQLRAQGAFISISHPFDPRRASWDRGLLRELSSGIDALEVLNGRSFGARSNRAAKRFAVEHGLLGTAGSDAHSRSEIGQVRMRMPAFHDPVTMRKALASAEVIGGVSPGWVRLASRYAALRKALGWQPPVPKEVDDHGA